MDMRTTSQTIIETIPSADLIRSWRSDFGIDVTALFDGVETIDLVRDEATGRVRFEPAPMGDAAFYQALRRFDWYHPDHKEEFAAAAARLSQGRRVLDVGAGAADFAKYVPADAYRGLEADPAAVGAAQARGLDVRPLSLNDWRDHADFEPVDLAASFQVIEHVADPDDFAAGLFACVKPGGLVAIGAPDAESYVAELPDFMLNAPPHHVSWWNERTLTGLLDGAGLRVVDVERFAVEPWERRLYWMAQIAKAVRGGRASPAFGRALLLPKALGWFGAWPMQWTPPKAARGSTLLVTARR